MAIKDKIRKIRILNNYSQAKLSSESDINSRLLQKYESGEQIPRDENLRKLSDALNQDVWALKDIDFDKNNSEATRQLLFLLEEKGLFSLDDLNVTVNYVDEKPTYSINIPISKSWADMFITWKYLETCVQTGEEDIEKLDRWKYNIDYASFFIFLNWLERGRMYKEGISTEELIAYDILSSEEKLDLIEQHKYTYQDLVLLLRDLNYDRYNFKKETELYKRLVEYFYKGIIHEDYQNRIFEQSPVDEVIYRFPNGIVREAYEEASNLKKNK